MDVPGFALITGGASGIGRACALGFAKEGCAGIALIDLNAEALVAVKAEIEDEVSKRHPTHLHSGSSAHASPFKVLIFPISVTDEDEVIRCVNTASSTFGRLDYVVNAAGIAMKHPGGSAFVKSDDWKRVLDINLNGSFYVFRAAAQIMLKQERILSSIDRRPLQRGSIINFSSIQGFTGIPLSTAYTTAKTAIIGLTRTASEDYAKDGLRVNAICPGYTETPMTTKNPDVLKAMEGRILTAVPMQRMGNPREIADGVLYLAGGRSSFVTGSALVVDGGYISR